MQNTPKGNRLHIAIFGKRNAGKSSLINALTEQSIALVSEIAGTTTDPVYKAMELLPIGPVMFIDTAGLDDEGTLGELRISKTMKIVEKTDLALIVLDAQSTITTFDQELLQQIKRRNIPFIGVVNKIDQLVLPSKKEIQWEQLFEKNYCKVSAVCGNGIEALKNKIIENMPNDWEQITITGGLIEAHDYVILVVPIDHAAPKGRLILPQVQTIRDILDHEAICTVLKETELSTFFKTVVKKPKLVITDSQAFSQVAKVTPEDVALTSFSILFARLKGDLKTYIKSLCILPELRVGDRILIAEGCTHHRQEDDIGTVKIPRWLNQYVGGDLAYTWVSGTEFPDNLQDYRCIIHCGACMMNRRAVLYRLNTAAKAGIPIVNYGILIAYLKGILPRALAPFSELTEVIKKMDMIRK